jgi:hypothetical protein
MFPWNVVPALRVAELPTYHQTLDALAPLVRRILLLTAVMTVDEGAWKTQTALALPAASRVRSPDTSIDELVADI